MTTFDKFNNYLGHAVIGDVIRRHEILAQEFGTMTTVDNYRNWFTKAGYLKWVKAGFYEVVKTPYVGLTSRTLRKLAYPHYKNWYEYKNSK
jgi:hypothetical protein